METLRTFNTESVVDNVAVLRILAQRIRSKDYVGSDDDELCLHRSLQDLELLSEIIEYTRQAYQKLSDDAKEAKATMDQIASRVDTYEAILARKDEEIKKLKSKPKSVRKKVVK